MQMNEADLKRQTKTYALEIMKLVETLPRSRSADVIARQLLRCATSVGANYRAACRAKSMADFVAKLAIVEEEADESLYWLELLIEGKIIDSSDVATLMIEGNRIVAITVSSIKTARGRK